MKLSRALSFILPAIAAAQGQGGNPNLFGGQGGASNSSSNRLIIGYKNENGRSKAKGNSEKVHLELGRQKAVAVTMNENAANGLRGDPDIAYVEVDEKRYPYGTGLRGGGPTSFKDRGDSSRRKLAETTPYGISMVQADQLAAGSTDRKICIIDSGYDITHPDLPTSGVTGVNDGSVLWNTDVCSHGTHVAGTIAALGSNNKGVVGVFDDVKLFIVPVFDGTNCGWTYSSSLADAVDRCVDAGANIISMSLGGGGASTTENNAFKDAHNKNVLSIAAAGNDGNTACSYPASYPIVMSVGGVDSSEGMYAGSQRNQQVEIAAPGVDVLSTVSSGSAYFASSLTVVGASGLDVTQPFAFDGAGTVPDPLGSFVPLVDCGLADASANPPDVGDCPGAATGFVCLIGRGDINFIDKADYCANAGGIGAVIFNNVPGPLSGVTFGQDTSTGPIPTIGISDTEGQALLAKMVQGTALSASFAVSGPVQGYSFYTGTSMATPHVSAVAAKIWSHHPTCSAKRIRDALRCTTGQTGHNNDYGYGIVRTKDAHDALSNGCAMGCGSPDAATDYLPSCPRVRGPPIAESAISPPDPFCGNQILEDGEECDGLDLNGETCTSRGFASGALACSDECAFNTSGCSTTQVVDTPSPTTAPTSNPTQSPSGSPTKSPTGPPVDPGLPTTPSPTTAPTSNPTQSPSAPPTKNPTGPPVVDPTPPPDVCSAVENNKSASWCASRGCHSQCALTCCCKDNPGAADCSP